MSSKKNNNLTPEQKEKEAILLENKMLAILMPSVGLAAFVIGLVGFILLINTKLAPAILMMILCVLGAGGIAYGVVCFIKKQKNKLHKAEQIPSETPKERPAK